MHRGLAPVAGAPEHVDPGPVQVVRKDLVELVRVLVLEDGFHARGGIGGGRVGHVSLDRILHRVRVRLLGIAVQGEMVPAGGLADDEDAHGRTVVRERRVRQRGFLDVLPLFGGLVAEGVDNVGPRHQETPEFRGVAVDPGPVLHVPEHEHEESRHAAAEPAQEPLPGAVFHFPPEDVDARNHAQQEDIKDEREGEEARRLGILRPEHVPHHLVRHEHVVVVHEIEHHGIAEQGERHDALAHEAEQPHQHVVQQEVQHKQQEGGRHGDDDAVGAGFHVGKQVRCRKNGTWNATSVKTASTRLQTARETFLPGLFIA